VWWWWVLTPLPLHERRGVMCPMNPIKQASAAAVGVRAAEVSPAKFDDNGACVAYDVGYFKAMSAVTNNNNDVDGGNARRPILPLAR
jgi:hypothetical protein